MPNALVFAEAREGLVRKVALEAVTAARTLVDHLPPDSQLAVAGRHEPMLGLPRLRSEGRVLTSERVICGCTRRKHETC